MSSNMCARWARGCAVAFRGDGEAASPIIGEVRGAGLMLGIEIVADKDTRTPFDPALQAGLTFDRIAYENGLIARCMGDTLGFSPPADRHREGCRRDRRALREEPEAARRSISAGNKHSR